MHDAHAAYCETLSLGIPDKRLVGFGGSLGSDVAVALAVKIAAPLLIVHGTADRSIPYDFGRRLFALAESRKPSSPIPRVATFRSRASCNGLRG